MGLAWVFRHPTIVETEFVGPEWSLDTPIQGTSNLKNRSEPEIVHGHGRLSDLPSPEERIFERIHTSQRKTEQSIPGSLIPILPVVPERTIGVRRGIWFDTPQVEATVIVTVAVFSSNSDTEIGLAGKAGKPFGKQTAG